MGEQLKNAFHLASSHICFVLSSDVGRSIVEQCVRGYNGVSVVCHQESTKKSTQTRSRSY